VKRYLEKSILKDLQEKIVLLSGPRQVGKIKKIQVVKDLKREKTLPDGAEMRRAHQWLAEVSLS
jgi:hypothetical protein